MSAIVEISPSARQVLLPLFKDSRYDQVLIDSVLEGAFGYAYTDSAAHPAAARLDSGAFTMLGGNPQSGVMGELLHVAPIFFVTPETDAWRNILLDEFGSRISRLRFTEFLPTALDRAHLALLIHAMPPMFELRRVDRSLAEQLPADTGNEYFLENFDSIDDFWRRGIGYCVVYEGRIIGAATSTASSQRAIDIEIEITSDFRGRGIGAAVGARLVSHCLEFGIEPRWLAANSVSERLALKLGYTKGEVYETFAIQQ